MKVEIFVVSCAKHFSWLKYCLQSIALFARGFSGVTILIPRDQESQLSNEIKTCLDGIMPLTVRLGDEWPNKGMLWHMAQIMRADEWCPDADFILHTDSDCLFTERFTPEDYIVDGKPVLYYEKFETLTRRYPQVGAWHLSTQVCLPFPVKYETMRRHPAVHYRILYSEARRQVEIKTEKPIDEYIASCRNEYPQTFCEFVTLGNVAMECFWPQYHLVNTEPFKDVFPPQKLSQCWSHSPPEIPQAPHYKGKPFPCTPDELLRVCSSGATPKIKIIVFVLTHNNADVIPFFLRHYSTFADEISAFDDFSTDGTRELLEANPKVLLRNWPHPGSGIDEVLFSAHWQDWYRKARGGFDWVIIADSDEIIYAPDMRKLLAEQQALGYEVIRTNGWNMTGNGLPKDDGRQIWEISPMGVRAPIYSKPVVFQPHIEIKWNLGKHALEDCSPKVTPTPLVKLLHYRYMGSAYTRAKNAKNYARCGLATGDKGAAWSNAPNYRGADKEHSPEWADFAKTKAINALEAPFYD